MSNENTQLAPVQEGKTTRAPVAFGNRGIVISQYDDLVRFAETVSKSGLAPKGMESAQSIFVAVQMGLEVGLSPMAALQNIAVVNGRPTIWGDAQLAVCRGTGDMEAFEEWFEIAGQRTTRNPSEYKDDTAAVCRVKRRDGQEVESAFSVADAKRANLWGKAGPWTQYPFRMLRNRARSFALRDCFGDALKGFRSTEEAQDQEPERDVTPPQASESKLFKKEAPALPAAVAPVEVVKPKEATKPKPKAEAPAPVVESAEAQPNLMEVAPVSLPDQIRELVKSSGVKWSDALAILKRNQIIDGDFAAPDDAPDEVLSEAIHFWPSIIKLVKGGAK
jgi:hypothetical protein